MIRILLASLFAFLVFAAPASADPISAIIANAAAAIKASVVLKTIAQFALSTGLSLLAQKLRGKPKEPGLQNSFRGRGATAPATSVLGRAATVGHWIYHGSHDYNNHRYHEVVELGDLPGATLERLIIDGEYSDLGALNADWGYVVPAKDRTDKDQPHRCWIRTYDGSQTTADATLVTHFGSDPDRPWTADHILKNRPVAYMAYEYDRKAFPRGQPELRFEMLGPPMYDPRLDDTVGGSGSHRWADKSTWSQTENLVVLIYNIMRGIDLPNGKVWGGRCDAEDLPLSWWAAAMNACDVEVDGRPKYRGGIEVDFTRPPKEFIEELLAGCAGQMVELGGVWYIQVDAPATSAVAITDDDLSVSHARTANPYPGMESTFNAVTVSHPDPEALWNATPGETLTFPDWEDEDGVQRVFDLKLMAVPYREQGLQLANMMAKDNRRFRRHQGVLPPDYFFLNPLQTFAWTSVSEGYSSKLFEIFEAAYDPFTFNLHVSIRERDPDDFDPDLSLEIAAPAQAITPIARPDGGVPDFDFNGITIDDASGPRRPGFEMTWTPDLLELTATALAYEVRVASTQIVVASGTTLDLEAGRLVLTGDYLPGETYEARPKPVSITRETTFGDWVSALAPAVSDQVRVVQLSAAAQAFEYDASGNSPSPADATVTATARNTLGTPYFEFLVDGVSVQNGTSNTYAYTPPASIVDMPELITVRLREDDGANPVLAEDILTTFGLRSGATTLTGNLTNELHAVPADASGNSPVMTGSGTTIEVFFGATRLTFDGAGTSAGTYTVAASAHAGTVTIGAISPSGDNAVAADHSALTSDVAVIRYTITGQDTGGNAFGLTLDQSLSKVRAGVAGAAGSDGVSGLSVVLDHPAAQVPANAAGEVQSYIGSGTTIEVFQGTATLQFTTSSSLSPGQWRIFDTDVTPGASDISVGSIIDSGHEATVAAHSSMDDDEDVVTIAYDIQVRTIQGSYVTLVAKQTVSKSKAGAAGADGADGEDGADGINGTNGINGVDGSDGADGLSVAQLVVFRRASSAPSTPSGGSFNFSTGTLTPPSGWSTSVPAGSDPLYTSITSASIVGNSGVDSTLTWSTPAVQATNGQSTYQAPIYKRNSGQPSTPSGGSFNFGTNTLTPPSGWNASVPTGTNPVWVSRYLFAVIGDTGVVSAGSWTSPQLLAESGVDGSDGISTFVVPVYRRASSPPSSPSGGSYNFGTQNINAPSGWTEDVPNGTDPLYISTALASVQGTTGVDSTLSWSSPRKVAQDGADGATGDEGAQGDTGNTTANGIVYFQTLQSTNPGTPTGTNYNVLTGQFASLTSGWGYEPPDVTATDTANKLWRSRFSVLIDGETGSESKNFLTPTSVKMIADDLQSDAYIPGVSGWRIDRVSGDAEFGAVSIRDEIEFLGLKVDLSIFADDGTGGLAIKGGGVTTPLIGANAASAPMGHNTGSVLTGSTGGGGYQTAAQRTVDVTDVEELQINWRFEQAYSAGEAPDWGYRLKRGSTTLDFRTNMEFGTDLPNGSWVDTSPGTGSQTYTLEWWSTNDASLTAQGTIQITAARKK